MCLTDENNDNAKKKPILNTENEIKKMNRNGLNVKIIITLMQK